MNIHQNRSKNPAVKVLGIAAKKEDGEITHDCTDEEADEEEKLVLRQLTPEPEQSAKLKQLEKDESKEEGEITDDSDDEDENIENLLENKTPVTIRSKSTLESDCRSPLLIENSEPVFEKALSSELAVMAAKNNAPRHRKPLGDKNDDSLVIWADFKNIMQCHLIQCIVPIWKQERNKSGLYKGGWQF